MRGVEPLARSDAHDQAADARMRRGDLLGAQHGARGLHHAPDRQIRRAAGIVQDANAWRTASARPSISTCMGADGRHRREIRLPPPVASALTRMMTSRGRSRLPAPPRRPGHARLPWRPARPRPPGRRSAHPRAGSSLWSARALEPGKSTLRRGRARADIERNSAYRWTERPIERQALASNKGLRPRARPRWQGSL